MNLLDGPVNKLTDFQIKQRAKKCLKAIRKILTNAANGIVDSEYGCLNLELFAIHVFVYDEITQNNFDLAWHTIMSWDTSAREEFDDVIYDYLYNRSKP